MLGPAAAQVGPPVRLLPPPPGAGPAIPEGTPATPPPAAAEGESIKATPLAPVDAAWIGAPGGIAHPLPQTMWQGTPRALVATALPQLAPTNSPALQDLARRLLLSNALAPAGQDAPDQPSLAALRLERLAALGEVEGALAVLDALPETMRSEAFDRRRAELRFAKNDVAGGCRQVQDSIARYQGLWWDRALIACQALAGDREKAALGLALLREQKVPRDATFDLLVEALGGHARKLDKLPEPTPLLMTLLAAAKLPLPADAVAAADLPSLRAWAGNEGVPPLQRLAAAERAAALGAIAPEALGDLYGKVDVKPEELGAAIKQRKTPASPRDRALLYQVAHTDPAAGARAATAEALLADARKRGLFPVMARVLAPILAELAPGPELASFAPEAVRALYAAGRADAAMPWLAIVDPATAPTLPLIERIAQGEAGPARDAAAVNGVIADLAKHDAGQATMAMTLLSALQDPVMETQQIILDPSREVKLPNATLTIDLQRAAAAKRVGETVLMSLLAAASGDRLSDAPFVLAQAVSGLRMVGLEPEARALALEAALDSGL